jgi:hypothetical protein
MKLGEQQTAALIEKTGSRDPWVLARSPAAPEELKNYLAMLGASVIIMHNPIACFLTFQIANRSGLLTIFQINPLVIKLRMLCA